MMPEKSLKMMLTVTALSPVHTDPMRNGIVSRA